MRYVSENHIYNRDTPPPRRSSLVPVATRDDLIRLVVGMQWQMAMAQAIVAEIRNDDGSWTVSTCPGGGLTRLQWNECGAPDIDTRPAVDIVDEWLGVR